MEIQNCIKPSFTAAVVVAQQNVTHGSDKKKRRRKKRKNSGRSHKLTFSCLAKNIGDSANRTARHEWHQIKEILTDKLQ